MPASRGRRRRQGRGPPEPLPKKDRLQFLTPRNIWSSILALCTLLGLVVLCPHVSADVDREADLSSALPNSVTFTNLGWITLHNLSVSFGLCRSISNQNAAILGRPNPNKCSGSALNGSIANVLAWQGHTLVADEKWTLPPANRFMSFGSGKLIDGDVDYIVSFWSWPIPFYHHRAEFRFATQRQPNGLLILGAHPSRLNMPADAGIAPAAICSIVHEVAISLLSSRG